MTLCFLKTPFTNHRLRHQSKRHSLKRVLLKWLSVHIYFINTDWRIRKCRLLQPTVWMWNMMQLVITTVKYLYLNVCLVPQTNRLFCWNAVKFFSCDERITCFDLWNSTAKNNLFLNSGCLSRSFRFYPVIGRTIIFDVLLSLFNSFFS